ncbi:MAG: hypothetical protein EBU93_08020 [Chlamydiae bacterium]|nr:hypothetical protein [Chlamydiota bacterium]
MKKTISTFALLLTVLFSNAQSFNTDKTSLANFVKRMYNTQPFEGVKVVDDYDHKYFMSVVSLDKAKYSSESTMNRVAQVKAQSQANTFFNGSTVTSDLVIRTTEKKDKEGSGTITETIETIKENASGFTQGLELLINFDNTDGKRMVFIYFREILNEKKK